MIDKIVLAGPFATVSHPLIHIVKSGALSDVAKEVEFRLWRNPDQLRAMILNDSVDFKGKEIKDKLEFFFEVLKKSEPKLIGGKIPDNDFYYK